MEWSARPLLVGGGGVSGMGVADPKFVKGGRKLSTTLLPNYPSHTL